MRALSTRSERLSARALGARLLVSLAALGWGASALAAETDDVARWQQAPRAFLPAKVEAATRSLAKGDAIFEAPLRWTMSLRLQSAVAITHGGNTATIPAGTQLPQVMFVTKAAPSALRYAFCTRIGIVNTASTFISDPWLFKAPFNAKDKQFCLEDTDNDGVLDRSFVRTIQHIMGRPDIIYTGPVSHDMAAAASFDPIDNSSDTLSVVLQGIGKSKVQAIVQLSSLHGRMNFSRLQTGAYDLSPYHDFRQVGAEVNLLGVGLNLQRFDPLARTADFDIRWLGNPEPVIIPDYVSAY